MSKVKIAIISVAVMIVFSLIWLFVGSAPVPAEVAWGVNFSQMQAQALGLDWEKTYLALLDDLGVKNIKLLVQWDFVEGKKDQLYFSDIDWQLQQAQSRNAKIVYVVGLKDY